LNKSAPRRMAVLRPLRLVIENFPEGQSESLEAFNHPSDESFGKRKISFGRELYIEREDFMETAPPKFMRLALNGWVRLRYAYLVHCHQVIKDATGEIVELRCTYDPTTKSGTMTAANQNVPGPSIGYPLTTHLRRRCASINPLFIRASPGTDGDLIADLNSNSLEVLRGARVEPALVADNREDAVQFERQGYFSLDAASAPGRPVFNRTIGLRDSWTIVQAKEQPRKDETPTERKTARPKGTQTCVYCRLEKDLTEFSMEHIFPQSLGGALCGNLFKTNQVCKRCNNILGIFVDGAFIKSFFRTNDEAVAIRQYWI